MSYRNELMKDLDDEITGLTNEISDLEDRIIELENENKELREMLDELIPPHKRAFMWVWESVTRFAQSL